MGSCYNAINAEAAQDPNLVKVVLDMMKIVFGIKDSKTRKQCYNRPNSTVIAADYTKFTTLILNNTYDINYDYVFERLHELIDYLPAKHIIGRYSQSLDNKKFPQYHLEACVTDVLQCCAEIML